jgi:hypothetical protein
MEIPSIVLIKVISPRIRMFSIRPMRLPLAQLSMPAFGSLGIFLVVTQTRSSGWNSPSRPGKDHGMFRLKS